MALAKLGGWRGGRVSGAALGAVAACVLVGAALRPAAAQETVEKGAAEKEPAMRVHYLEIVTKDVDAVCATYAEQHGVEFSEPVPELGNARTAKLAKGGLVGVRAPMREDEAPVVRPYMLVDDLASAVAAAKAAGAEIAIESMEIPGRGTIAIYVQGGVQQGLWKAD